MENSELSIEFILYEIKSGYSLGGALRPDICPSRG